MKKLLKYALVAAALSLFASCDDMNSVHQQYLDMPEITYIGIPKDVVANGGLGRVVFDWTLNADPKISRFVIEWSDVDGNEYSESVDVVRTADNKMTYSLALNEGTYNFVVYHKSAAGDESLKTTVSSRSFGSNYINTLANRSFTLSATLSGALFVWDSADGVISTTIEYQTADGATKSVVVDAAETQTTLSDFKLGGTFTLSTTYLPEGCIDYVSCATESFEFPRYVVGDKSKWLGSYNITARIVPDWSAPTTFGESITWGPVVIEESDVAGYHFKITGLMDPTTRAAIGVDNFAVNCMWRYLESTPQDYIQNPQQSTGLACTLGETTGTLYMTHRRTTSPTGNYGNAGWHFDFDSGAPYFGHFNNNGQDVLRFCLNASDGASIVDYYLPVLTRID